MRDLVHGETDSERMFALITAEIRDHGDDVADGVSAAVNWIADNVPVFALNFVLTTPNDLWAFRYPATHELHVLELDEGEAEAFEHRTDRIHAQSDELAGQACVTIASEVMDDEPGLARDRAGLARPRRWRATGHHHGGAHNCAGPPTHAC